MALISKVIQISTSNILGVEGVHPDYFVLTALCEDGSIWQKVNGNDWNCVLQAFKLADEQSDASKQ